MRVRAEDGSPGEEAEVLAGRARRHRWVHEGRGFTPSEKSTPIVRSVRKAEGLEAETARLPKRRTWSEFRSFKMPMEADQP